MPATHPTIRELAESIDTAELGLATTVTLIDGSPPAIQVPLDHLERQAATLQRWLSLVTVMDMISGRIDKNDPLVRLHLRGQLPSGQFVIITAFWPRTSKQARMIADHITRQRPHDLIGRLAALEA